VLKLIDRRCSIFGFDRAEEDLSGAARTVVVGGNTEEYVAGLQAIDGTPHLSRREREVLQLAFQGHTNADIARMLFISVATVRKHMEHIFDRTGIRTRSAAAALALPHLSPFTRPVPLETRR
jgi:DNA-binding CsgD family transcriptional regulator